MTKTKIKIEKCNCDQSLALEKELFELKIVIQELNQGHPADLGGELLGDGSLNLYPVGLAKYRLRMKKTTELEEKLRKMKKVIDYCLELLGENDHEIEALTAGAADKLTYK